MISFVILHYKSIDETLMCLKSIKDTFDSKKYSIIVVDNNTLSTKEIKKIKEYTNDLICLDKNYGFAKANNKGCAYAIEKYKPDFIAIINNDVFINQKNFLEIIENDYKKYNFDLLGPWIESRTGESCNPFPIITDLPAYINRTEKLIKVAKNPILYYLVEFFMKTKHFIKTPTTPKNGNKVEKNVALHGCAIIISKKYYHKYTDIFYSNTFLFHEEEFIYDRITSDGLVSVYDPKLKVYHKEGSSQKNKINRKSKLFKEQEKLKSLKLLLVYRSTK